MRLLVCLGLLVTIGCHEPQDRRWNILILLADDLGVDLVGAYARGADLPATPNVDALAARGVLFQNAWGNPLCSPTRATIQTGRYSLRTGIGWLVSFRGGGALPLEETILPEMLRTEAPTPYATGAFGKWHLGNFRTGGFDSPNLAGYSHFEGSPYNIGGSYFYWFKVAQGETWIEQAYATSDTVDSALKWIARTPEPWLAYVAFNAPHRPVHAPPTGLHSVDLAVAGSVREDPRPYLKAMIEAMDTEIGRLLRSIDPKVLERTVIFFLADNGSAPVGTLPGFDPARGKGTLHEGGIHVPFIVSGSIVAEPARESSALINTTDIFATVADLAGIDLAGRESAAERLDSVSLLPYLLDPAAPPRRGTIFAEMFVPNGWPPIAWNYAIRNERYKLIRMEGTWPAARTGPRFSQSPEQFYDLETDPLEHRDLLLDPPLSLDAQDNYERLEVELEIGWGRGLQATEGCGDQRRRKSSRYRARRCSSTG
jgi:arylsulfatase A-like enzyme